MISFRARIWPPSPLPFCMFLLANFSLMCFNLLQLLLKNYFVCETRNCEKQVKFPVGLGSDHPLSPSSPFFLLLWIEPTTRDYKLNTWRGETGVSRQKFHFPFKQVDTRLGLGKEKEVLDGVGAGNNKSVFSPLSWIPRKSIFSCCPLYVSVALWWGS